MPVKFSGWQTSQSKLLTLKSKRALARTQNFAPRPAARSSERDILKPLTSVDERFNSSQPEADRAAQRFQLHPFRQLRKLAVGVRADAEDAAIHGGVVGLRHGGERAAF